MKAITLHQPWAYLASIGAKQWETRSWPTSHRGLLAIHAGRDMNAVSPLILDHNAKKPSYLAPFDRYLKPDYSWLFGELHYGGIVGVVEVLDCQPADWVAWQLRQHAQRHHGGIDERRWIEEQLAFGDFSAGRYAWQLRPIIELTSGHFVRGYQRIWNVPAAEALLISASCAGSGVYLAPNSYPQIPERVAA